jgi:hypothetical protein
MFDDVDNLCVNKEVEDSFKCFQPLTTRDIGEITAKHWARETQDNMVDLDPLLDFFVGIMMYGNKTSTDVNQCSPLEPWMFTLILL